MSTMTVIVIMNGDWDYNTFNSFGFFIGTRKNLGQCFHNLNEYDDLVIIDLVKEMGLSIKYYTVPSDQVDNFCREFGSMSEPKALETKDRRTFHVDKNGAYIPAYYTLLREDQTWTSQSPNVAQVVQ